MPKTLLLVAEDWFGSSGLGLAQGFRELGWTVHHVNPNSFLPQHSTIFGKVLQRLTKPLSVYELNNHIVRIISNLSPDAFLTIKGSYIRQELFDILHEKNIPTINYYPDCHFNFNDVNEKLFKNYSIFVTTKSFQTSYLENILGKDKVKFIHHGYSPEVHKPIHYSESPIGDNYFLSDVSYVGTYSEYKAKWLEAVVSNFPSNKISIYGNGWHNVSKHPLLSSAIKNKDLVGHAYSHALTHSKVNIAVHFGKDDIHGWEDLVSTRSFEIPACKGFMLHIDNPEVRSLYSVGEEIDVFSTPEQLCEKISYYLSNDTVRTDMLEKAYSRCVPSYSYSNRARLIADFFKPTIN